MRRVIGYGYTSPDGTGHASYCRACLKRRLAADYASVIPVVYLIAWPLAKVLDRLEARVPEFGDSVGEINPWTCDDDGEGTACSGCKDWINPPEQH